MRAFDGTGLAKQFTSAGTSSRGDRCGALVAALLAITVLCCFGGAAAPAGASMPAGASVTAGAAAPAGAAPGVAAPAGAAAELSAEASLAQLALQQAQLTAADGAAVDWFGYAVAVYGDTALVGAPRHEVSGVATAGAAYVFVRSAGAWIAEAKLTATGAAAGDNFGNSVALSGDVALVGAPGRDTAGAADVGAAYVFVRSAGSWIMQAMLGADDAAAGDDFGLSVALSGDTALVGAPYHPTSGAVDSGAAYVFTHSGDF